MARLAPTAARAQPAQAGFVAPQRPQPRLQSPGPLDFVVADRPHAQFMHQPAPLADEDGTSRLGSRVRIVPPARGRFGAGPAHPGTMLAEVSILRNEPLSPGAFTVTGRQKTAGKGPPDVPGDDLERRENDFARPGRTAQSPSGPQTTGKAALVGRCQSRSPLATLPRNAHHGSCARRIANGRAGV